MVFTCHAMIMMLRVQCASHGSLLRPHLALTYNSSFAVKSHPIVVSSACLLICLLMLGLTFRPWLCDVDAMGAMQGATASDAMQMQCTQASKHMQ